MTTAALAVLAGSAPESNAQQRCTPFAASATGVHRTNPKPAAWVGDLYLSIGGADVVHATFVDVGTGADIDKLLRGLPFTGSERFTVTFDDANTFQIASSFVGVPGSTPFYYELNETGEIENGTGAFAGVTGFVTTHGPFLSPLKVPLPPWIGTMHGTLCGSTE